MRDAAGQLAKSFHLLRTEHVVLQLFARGNVHHRADQPNRFAGRITQNERALEQLQVSAGRAPETIFARPMIAGAGECVADCVRDPRAIFRMDVPLPETDLRGNGGVGVAENFLQALRPAQRAASYIPIPKSIIRGPGSQRKMFRALRRAIFR